MREDVTHQELLALLGDMPEGSRHEVELLTARATGYVWGWQDAGGAPHDTGHATRFGTTYGIHAAHYATQRISYRRNLHDAWRSWAAGRSIEDQR